MPTPAPTVSILSCFQTCEVLGGTAKQLSAGNLLSYVRLPSYLQITFDIVVAALAPTDNFLSLLEVVNDNGDVLLGVYATSAVNLMIMHAGQIVVVEGPELTPQYATQWTTVTIAIYPGLLAAYTSTHPRIITQVSVEQDVATFGKVYKVYSSSPIEVGTGGSIRNVSIEGKYLLIYLCFFNFFAKVITTSALTPCYFLSVLCSDRSRTR